MSPFTLMIRGLLTAVMAVSGIAVVHAADVTALMASGDVRFVNAAGQSRPAVRGGELAPGERVETGANGRVQLRFSDGGLVSVQPDTTFRVDEYRYNGREDGSEKIALALLKGAFRTVTGFIGRTNKANYNVYTPTATIGIRGTSYLAQLQGNALRVSVGIGRIALTSLGGTLEVGAGQTGFVPNANAQPQVVSVQPSLPPAAATDTTSEVKKSEERSANAAPTTITDTSGQIASLYTSTVTSGTTTTGHPAAGGTSSGGVSSALGTGLYAISYAAGVDVGIDSRTPVTATFGATGSLASYSWTTNTVESPTIGSNVTADVSGDQFITLGRWNGGTTGGQYFANTTGFSYNGNQGFHYVIGVQTPSMPTTGTATYAMLGATSPTVRDGSRSPGSATGELAVQWGGPNTKVGVHLKVTMPSDAIYEVLTTGGTANPALSELQATGNSTFSGNSVLATGSGQSCSGTCQAILQGFFAGPTQERAGLAYTISNGTSAKNIDGTMSFQPGSITTVAALATVSTGTVGPLGTAPDRVFTAGGGAVSSFGPGFLNGATFDTSNGLASFTTFVNTQSIGTASVANSGGDSFVAWGRWTNGSPVNVPGVTSLNANQGVPYLIGVPAVTVPASGTATYNLLGATAPVNSNGTTAPGTFAGSLAVSFAGAATRIGLDATVTMGTSVFTMATNGGLANPSLSQIGLSSTGTAANKTMWAGVSGGVATVAVTGAGCTACQATVLGSFFGSNLERAGLLYSIGGVPGGGSLQGTAAFTKAGAI